MTQAESARRFYDRVSRVYDSLADSSEREARTLGLKLLAPSSGERVLEIGCGTGMGLVEAAEMMDGGGRVFGADVSTGMLEVARSRVQASSVADRVGGLSLADAKQLPWARSSFDAVFLSFTLELFPREEIPIVLAEIARVLVPRGRLGVVALNDDGTATAMVDFYRFLHRHFPHIIDCRPIEVTVLLEASGFEVVAEEAVSIWGLPVAALAARLPVLNP